MKKFQSLICLLLGAAVLWLLCQAQPYGALQRPKILLHSASGEPQLDVRELKLLQETSFLLVLGRVENTDQSELTNLALKCAFKDGDGAILEERRVVLAPSVLAPGCKAGFGLAVPFDPRVLSLALEFAPLGGERLSLEQSWREEQALADRSDN